MNTITLTVAALAWREARHLRPCFRSLEPLIELTGAQTLVLLDAEADEATARIAREIAQRVAVRVFDSFPAQRNHALDLANSQWVFFIDPDERCTPQLARQIAQAVQSERFAAYRVPRRS